MRHSFITVEGAIGVGKTALATQMANYVQENVKLVLEDVNNPFLSDFYKDGEGSAFNTQLYFLLTRFDQLKELRQRELFSKRILSDFMFEKDKIFAYLTLSDSELSIYERLYDLLAGQVPTPDLVVYLTASVSTLKKRIARRGRAFELNIDESYLEELSKAYNYYFYHYKNSPLLVVNTDDIDFVHRQSDLEDLVSQIESMERGTKYYVPKR